MEVGQIIATLGDEERTWTALYRERDGNAQSSSTYQARTVAMTETHSLSIGGQVGTSMSTNGSLRISFTAAEPIDACPCTFDFQEIAYVVDFPDDTYETAEAQVTLERFAQSADGTYEASGSFSGTLTRTTAGEPQSLPVEGTFDVRRIVEVGR